MKDFEAQIQEADFVAGFGDVSVTLETLQKQYPKISFEVLRQTHSDIVVEAPFSLIVRENCPGNFLLEGDAHFTFRRGQGLCIRTADCVPILIYAPLVEKSPSSLQSGPAVAAIHAGWRGVEAKIISKTISALVARGCDASKMRAWIGPHIGPESFEVGGDVAQRLNSIFKDLSLTEPGEVILPHVNPAKNFVNLELIVRSQLRSTGIFKGNIKSFAVDTFKSNEYHSYRREPGIAGRQISFIALI